MNYACVTICTFIMLYHINYALADTYAECEGVPDGTYVASSDSCQAYIYCNGEDSEANECEDGDYFDAEDIACDAAENVYCPLEQPDESGEPDESEEPEEYEEPADPTPAPAQTTTTTPTTTTIAASTATTTFDPLVMPHVVKDKCDQTDSPNELVFVLNRESCSDYFFCYHGQAIEMHCTDQLHFNAQTGKCDFPEHAQCTLDRPNANKCLPHIMDFFPHPDKCNYFYYCIRGFLTLQQCPFYYGWDIERRSCVQMSQAKCYSGARRA